MNGQVSLAELIRDGKKMPKVLYHYTTPDAFVEIVGHRDGVRFMCTNYRFLNDGSEFVDGYEMALRWMKERGCESSVFENIRKATGKVDRIEDWLSTPWILSLCGNGDSVAHWMAYTDRSKGGFAIGVDSEMLENCVREADATIKGSGPVGLSNQAMPEPIGGMFVAPCLYYRKGAKDLPSAFTRGLEHVFSRDRLFGRDQGDKYAVHCLRHVLRLSALLKRDDYKFENEWRVVFVPMRKETGLFGNIRIISGKARVSLRKTLDRQRTRRIVKEVVVAPHGGADKNEMIANLVKLTDGGSFKVNRSASSYR